MQKTKLYNDMAASFEEFLLKPWGDLDIFMVKEPIDDEDAMELFNFGERGCKGISDYFKKDDHVSGLYRSFPTHVYTHPWDVIEPDQSGDGTQVLIGWAYAVFDVDRINIKTNKYDDRECHFIFVNASGKSCDKYFKEKNGNRKAI